MTIAKTEPDDQKKLLRELMRKKRAQIAADNAAARTERNARRWKSERDPVEYEKQKVEQRKAYALQIETEEGREVRSYVKVPGKTRGQHKENAKARDAERKRIERSRATQSDKDAEADRKWVARKQKAGWSEAQIAEGLLARQEERLQRRRETDYDNHPLYGAF